VAILCPLGQPKKAIGHESQIESWLTPAHPFRLLAFQKSTALLAFPGRRLSISATLRFAAAMGALLSFDGSEPFCKMVPS